MRGSLAWRWFVGLGSRQGACDERDCRGDRCPAGAHARTDDELGGGRGFRLGPGRDRMPPTRFSLDDLDCAFERAPLVSNVLFGGTACGRMQLIEHNAARM